MRNKDVNERAYCVLISVIILMQPATVQAGCTTLFISFQLCNLIYSCKLISFWLCGKESAEVWITQKIGKERGNSYRKNEERSGWKAPTNTRKLNWNVSTITDV